jgi:hypothetical protein
MVEMTSILGVNEATLFKYMGSNLFFKKEEICTNPNKDYSNYNFKLDKHIYHYNKFGEKVYTLYYKSLSQIVEILCLGDPKKLRYTYASPLELHKSRKVIFATEVMMESSQNSAFHGAKRDSRKQRKTEYSNKLLNSDDVFYNSSISVRKPEDSNLPGVECLTDSVLLVNTDKIDVACASHTHVAKIMGRHRTTISKRLKKSQIKKYQLYLTNKQIKAESKLQYSIQGNKNYYITDAGHVIIDINGTPYQKFCNIYKNTYTLLYHNLHTTYKKVKRVFKKSVDKVIAPKELPTEKPFIQERVSVTEEMPELKPGVCAEYYNSIKNAIIQMEKKLLDTVKINWKKVDVDEKIKDIHNTLKLDDYLINKLCTLVVDPRTSFAPNNFESSMAVHRSKENYLRYLKINNKEISPYYYSTVFSDY